MMRLSQKEVFMILLRHVATEEGFDPDTENLVGDVDFDIDVARRRIDYVDVTVTRKSVKPS